MPTYPYVPGEEALLSDDRQLKFMDELPHLLLRQLAAGLCQAGMATREESRSISNMHPLAYPPEQDLCLTPPPGAWRQP